MKRNLEVQKKIDQIFSGQSSELDRMAEGFHFILELHLEDSNRELELLQALGDREKLIKEQIKQSTVRHVLRIFDDCYFRTTGEVWRPKQEASNE